MKKIFLIVTLLISTVSSLATTWDEPWQKEIIEKSDYFALATIISTSDTLVIVEIVKAFGNNKLSGQITIDGFFLLELCSFSEGHGPEFNFIKGEKGYFFLKKGTNENYQIPTPTSGFDRVVKGNVHATYRHTYHQAAIPPEIYEFTYTQIWNKYHTGSFEKAKLIEFINEQIKQKPAGFEEDEIALFFTQHVALETSYLLGIELDFKLLKKFSESENFHARVAAIRAMGNLNNKQVKKYLLAYLADKKKDNFTKVIAIWSLWQMKDADVNKKLWELRSELSDEENGFGGNLMDPRVCTLFPSPQRAIIALSENN